MNTRSSTHKTKSPHLAHPLQLLVILQKESQILITNINFRIHTILPMFLLRLLPAREPMLIHLILDLRSSIAHVNTRVHVRGAHLRLWALEGWEEFGVE